MNGTSGFGEVRSSIPRSSTNRLLREQQPQFGTGSWRLFRTHSLIALSNGISTQRERFLALFSCSFLLFALTVPSLGIAGDPQVRLVAVEITQAIQRIDPTNPWNVTSTSSNTVTLIAKRKTYVRAYFDLKDPSSGSVNLSGKVDGKLNGTVLAPEPSLAPVIIQFSENDQLTLKREDFSKSLNFALPDSWVEKKGQLQLSLQIDGPVSCIDSEDKNCSTRSITADLQEPKPLRVRLVVLTEEDNNSNLLAAPTPTDTGLVKSWLKRAFPIQNLGPGADSYFEVGAHRVPSSFSSCVEANDALAVYRIGVPDKRIRLVGLFANRTREFGGCAAGVLASGTSDPQLSVSVPTGANLPSSWPSSRNKNGPSNWDTDGTYADWLTGHELAHTFGLRHLAYCDALPAPANPPFDDPPFNSSGYAGEISDAQGSYVGFDVGHLGPPIPGANPAGLSLRPLPGSDWHDIRTYCDKRWISSTVYEWIMQALDLENPDVTPPADAVPPGSPTNLRVSQVNGKGKGLDRDDREGLPRVARIISESVLTPANSPFYPRMYNNTLSNVGPEILRKVVTPYPLRGQRKAQSNALLIDFKSGSRPELSEVTVQEGDFLAVVATVNLTQKTAAFQSTSHIHRAEVLPEAKTNEATLQLLDDDDHVLVKKSLFIRRNMRVKKDDDETGLIFDAIPLPPGKTFKSLKLFLAGRPEPVAIVPISKEPPQVILPTVEYKGGRARLQCGAVDPDTDTKDLTYTIEISFDNGTTWHTLAVGRPKQQIVIGLNELKILGGAALGGVKEAQIKVTASDGFNSSALLIIAKVELSQVTN